MEDTNTAEVRVSVESDPHDRASKLKAFDDTKAGVKGLVDSGVAKVPQIFIRPPDNSDNLTVSNNIQLSVPVIDLKGIDTDPIRRRQIVGKVRNASEACGFFQVINHGVPVSIMEEMKEGVRRFYEQDTEEKKRFYTRDITKKVVYNSNFDLYTSPVANWRDTFYCLMFPNPPPREELPEACRYVMTRTTSTCIF